MAITHGSKAKISIGGSVADNPEIPDAAYADWASCELMTDATWNQQRAEVETTTNRDGFDDTFIPGHRNRTFDFAVAFDAADAAQVKLLDSFDGDDDPIWIRYRPKGDGAGLVEFIFAGFVTNCPVTTPGKDRANMTVTMRVSGAVTRRAQAA